MNRQNDVIDDVIELGTVTDETRGSPIGVGSDDKNLHRAPMGLSHD